MNTISLKEARQIMGESQFIGPEDIKNTFGFIPNIIPPIPFSVAELKRAKVLGWQLILYINRKADGMLFTMEDMIPLDNKTSDGKVFLYNKDNDGNWLYEDKEVRLRSETPRLGWRLTDPEIIDNSTSKNYLEQTEVIMNYLQNVYYKGVDMPTIYQEATDEFNNKKDNINTLIDSGRKTAAKKLSKLSINQLTRERLSEIIYRCRINEQKLGVKNITSTFAWSNSLSADGLLVNAGLFNGDCIAVGGWPTRNPSRLLIGVYLSIGAS